MSLRMRAADIDFDYVIVGGGSAGCVLAARLSEDPNVRVCLIEAGPPRSPSADPYSAGRDLADQSSDAELAILVARRSNMSTAASVYPAAGHVLGGSSSINGSIYIRGHRADYDDWATWGNPGWSYEEVLPYFRKSENNEQFRQSPYHGSAAR